jgi:hypothetical protein
MFHGWRPSNARDAVSSSFSASAHPQKFSRSNAATAAYHSFCPMNHR